VANGEIIKVKDGSTVEIIQAKPFNLALAKLEDLEDNVAKLKAEVMKIKVTDVASFTKADELLTMIKAESVFAEETMDPFRTMLNRAKEFVLQRQRRVTNAAEEIRGALNAKMVDYSQKVERERKAEEERQQKLKQAELEREAENKRLADQEAATELRRRRVAEIKADLKAGKITLRESKKLLEEAGATEEAMKVQAKVDEQDNKAKAADEAKKTTVESEVPRGGRTNRTFKVVRPQEVKLKYLKPDDVAIGEVVRNRKLTIAEVIAEVGGIEVEEDKKF
jgi:hypothetical protein